MSILNYIEQTTQDYLSQMSKETRKKYGQFFTSKETAFFMANLLSKDIHQTHLTVLDPGAGSGILSAALLEVLLLHKEVVHVHLVCYENDSNILPLLRKNLEYMKKNVPFQLSYTLIQENYIVSQKNDYQTQHSGYQYDLIIGNPPYKKIGKNSAEADAMPDICYGTPNLYFLFAEMSLFNLKDNGEMVYIIPRSWTSGAYFQAFRQKFLHEGVLTHIHLFESRNKVFEKENVLQETMIIKIRKTKVLPDTITVTTTQSNHDFSEITEFHPSYTSVVSGKQHYVFLITEKEDENVLISLNRFPYTLPQLGFKMKTGLTVEFRNASSLRNTADSQTIPLFYPHHINQGKVVFPGCSENEYIIPVKTGLQQKNRNYLFVKRFTTKEESRRLQCAVYLANEYPDYAMISTQNKLNFIDCIDEKTELSESIVYGLYVLFNSSLYDQYYRILNGSTQVNATEINELPMPSIEMIKHMGSECIRIKDLSVSSCDKILQKFLSD